MLDRAREKVEEILGTHRPLPLTASQEEGIEEALGEARTHYRQQGVISDEEWSRYMEVIAG
jgi:hypothetical protein